ncbi:universal stress protein, partial [Mycobacterium tuberculosis]|uniref:universal stress protein n=1 Tax=Mycobacterium tuberculosis TaxID=1773 RepID=UPI0039BCE07D
MGVDGSPISEAAVAFAAAEADRLGEPLIPVTVWTPVPLPRGSRAYPDQYLSSMQELSEETLAVALAGLRQTYPDLQLQPRVERGYPSEVINRAATTASLAV